MFMERYPVPFESSRRNSSKYPDLFHEIALLTQNQYLDSLPSEVQNSINTNLYNGLRPVK